jgi:hypothetical protein
LNATRQTNVNQVLGGDIVLSVDLARSREDKVNEEIVQSEGEKAPKYSHVLRVLEVELNGLSPEE